MIEATRKTAETAKPYRVGALWLALLVLLLLSAAVWSREQLRERPEVVEAWLKRFIETPATDKLEAQLSTTIHSLALLETAVLLGTLLATRRAARKYGTLRSSLIESMQFAQATFDALPAQVGIIDDAGLLLASNEHWRKCSGAPNELGLARIKVGENFLTMCDNATGPNKPDATTVAAALREVLAGRIMSKVIECAPPGGPDDAWYVLRISRFPVQQRAGAVLLFDDVTQQKRAELQVQRSREAADNANAAKSAFLANMSHEIRTPMAAIIGYADLLQDPRQSPEQRARSVQIIRRNGEHLLGIINDILDLSKIEANKIIVEKLRTSLPSFVCDVGVVARQRAEEKGLKFSVVFDGPVPQSISTDALRLKQVLLNLLSNAVKFTQTGRVTLRVACENLLDGSRLQFDVIDTGIGMSDEQRERLFTPFTQGDERTTRRFGGTGLGLSISRSLARLLGGDIRLHSVSGVGTTASFWIDSGSLENVPMIERLREHDLAFEQAGLRRGRLSRRARVLLAEDGEDNRELLTAFLHDAGAEVICAENGAVAIDLAMKQSCELILMDMQMPEVDGYTAARRLRQLKFCKPIVALTANAMTDDRRRCLDAGCDEYLSKPVDRDRLVTTIAKLLGISLIGEPAVNDAVDAVPQPADDQPRLRSNRADDQRLSGVLARFVHRLPARVSEIKRFSREGNSPELIRALHQLKGAAGGYGFPDVSETAAEIEAALKAGRSAAELSTSIENLLQLIERVEGYAGSMPMHSQPLPAGESSRPAEGPGLPRIMLVDDSPERIERVRHAIADMPVELRTYVNGPAALAEAATFAPAVVLIDVTVAGSDGFELRRAIAQLPECEHSIALLLTDVAPTQGTGCDLNADDRMVRPDSASNLRTEIIAALSRSKQLRQLNSRVRTDAETGLPNRRYVDSKLPAELSAARRAGQSLCCMIVKLDRSVAVATPLSPAGQSPAQRVASLLIELYPDQTVARIGDEQFMITLAGIDRFTADDLARSLAERLSAALVPTGATTHVCNVSFAMADQQVAAVGELIEQAIAGKRAVDRSKRVA